MNLRVLLLCVLVALLVSAPVTAAPVGYSPGELPLGKPGLEETRTTRQLAPGVTYTRIVRGAQSGKDFYTVDAAFEADQSAAQGLAERLRSDGYKPRIEEISQRAPTIPGADHPATWSASESSRRRIKPTPSRRAYRPLYTRVCGSSTPARTTVRRRGRGSCTCSG
jgi:hypothetical protein